MKRTKTERSTSLKSKATRPLPFGWEKAEKGNSIPTIVTTRLTRRNQRRQCEKHWGNPCGMPVRHLADGQIIGATVSQASAMTQPTRGSTQRIYDLLPSLCPLSVMLCNFEVSPPISM